MDILSDLFRDAGLRRRLLDSRRLADGGALRFPCDRSVGFHVVLDGTLWIHGPTLDAPLALAAGDIAVMARGTDHLVATTPRRPRGGVITAAEWMAPADQTPVAAHVVSGAYQLWHAPLHPVLTSLPPWYVVKAGRVTDRGPVPLLVALLADEVAGSAPGRETVMHALLDALFAHLIRALLASGAVAPMAAALATDDAVVRRALGALHADSARAWTLADLAREVGVSRSALAERFRAVVGEPPLSYLRTLRLQRAMRHLVESDAPLARIAESVGYRDAFAFSKAFKRSVGVAPGEFRRLDATERGLPWRLPDASAVGAR